MQVRAHSGTVRWGYYAAAAVRDVILEWDLAAKEYRLKATVVTADTFRLSQQPLVFQIAHDKGVWRWPVKSLQVADGTLTAVLGPKEKNDARSETVSPAAG